ncbi:MAG: Flp family type IVb pilin [Bryobacteraceae bacterium]|jgi:Flp pilus assembly pilin Flp
MQNWIEEFGSSMRAFWLEDEGQNLIEHSLLIAFVCLAAAAMFINAGASVRSIWTTSNSQLAVAAAAATT